MGNDVTKDKVLHSLLELDKYKDYHYNKMKNHLNSSNANAIYSAPVNPKYLSSIEDNHYIVLENNVYDALETIDQYNIKYKKEVPFILYGYEAKDGAIIFDDIYCDFKKLKDASASFQNLQEYLYERMWVFVEDNMKNKVICLGHTHPFTGKISYNYSVQDLCCHMFYFGYDVFANPYYNNKVFSLMKSISNDFNFIYYDINKQIFERVDKVYLKEKRKKYILLDSYKNCDE